MAKLTGFAGGAFLNLDMGGVPALSNPAPSGTVGGASAAALSADTTQSSGTLYWVISTTNNVSTATAVQIEAGQNSAGVAAAFAGSAAIASLLAAASALGLAASTLYYYALVQNNANGDSNVVSGSFTTAATDPTGNLRAGFLINLGGMMIR